MTNRPRLTSAQHALLNDIRTFSKRVSSRYKPAISLVSHGLATMEAGYLQHAKLTITPNGTARLNDLQKGWR